jgi:Domain of Unknown Function with PDB structure (DUF3858)/Domain of Unknown Function with PDB structure (DUF3857)/Transglutaminase-like superfamily
MSHKLLLKTILLSIFTLFIRDETAFSQNKPPVTFGKVSLPDFDLPESNVVDSNSSAVIIASVGSIGFIGNKRNWFSYVYKKNIRIKILNKKGYDLATVKIYLYGQGDNEDKLDDFRASTYNIDNGKVTEVKLTNSDLFTEKLSNNVNEKKFTMSNVKEGSMIEYSYEITSYHYYYLPGWSFQNLNYPCLYSEFTIGIPDLLRYANLHYGMDSFYSSKTSESYKTIQTENYSVNSAVQNRTWIIKNIAAFKNEDYINDPEGYLDKMEFTLTKTSNGQDVHDVSATWKSVEDELLASKSFGAAINVENAANLNNTLQKISSGNVPDASKQIYSYVRDNFTCVPDDYIYIENDLYNINKLHKGNVAELNMLLIALLRQKGISAKPVILSTKEYGVHPVSYPILEKLNYVICMMQMGKDTIFLDASDPVIGFGKLPLSCYNGHAQIIDQQHSGSLYFNPNTIKEQAKTYVTIVNDENGNGSSGSFESIPGYFRSYDLRKTINENGWEAYFKKIRLSYGSDVEIKNLQIDSLTQLEQPVKITYDINFKAGNEDDIIYFNPFISIALKANPFKATERKYPVEMPYPVDDTYELTMDIPKGYKVDELPKSVKVSFNGNDGFFEYAIQKDDLLVQLRSHIKLNRAIFAAEDYGSLRDCFAYIVKKQSEQIVFKKK